MQWVFCKNLSDRYLQIIFLVKDFTMSTIFYYAKHIRWYDRANYTDQEEPPAQGKHSLV